VPADVPFPAGSYFFKDLPVKGGFHRGYLVLGIDSEQFGAYVDKQWTKKGITMFRPDREPGEVESFFNAARGNGLFKANDVRCGTPHTQLLFIYRS
jgi:hypothetical protein